MTLTDSPGDFTAYRVNVNTLTLTRSDGASFTVLGTPEMVDFTKLGDVAELWGTAFIQVGTYVSATLVLDYTNAVISVIGPNGLPQQATVVDPSGAKVTTQTVHVILDPAQPFTVVPTFATSAAQRFAIDVNLAASSTVVAATAGGTATVTVRPYVTMGLSPPDNKLIRVRGPLINSGVNVGTYTVYIQPFHDAMSSRAALTLFVDANTLYAVNGTVTQGQAGISQLSQVGAGTTVTAAYTTFEPTATPNATAGKFHVKYLIGGSTLEDIFTQGLEGDVIARSGNNLTVRGSTLFLNNGTTTYFTADATVILGPATVVTADNTATTNLNYNSVAVGQHIVARGIAGVSNNVATLDASDTKVANTGSVRLIPTSLWGTLVSSAGGSLTMNVQTIDGWPVGNYAFAGNGTGAATDPVAGSFSVGTGALAAPVTTAGEPIWVDGLVAPFGSAPPAFMATALNAEAGVAASLRVYWNSPGANAPFTALSATGLNVNLASANFGSAVLRIGGESVDLTTLPAVQIVPQAATAATAPGLPSTFTPLFSFGDPKAVAPLGISVFSSFATFATALTAALPSTAALQFEARGSYNRATNTFSASSVDVVL